MTRLDLNALPVEQWAKRAAIITYDVEARAKQGATFLRETFEHRTLLAECMSFVFDDLSDAPRSDLDSLHRVWFFPWVGVQREMHEALNFALLGSYRAAFDNFRRALELALIGAYFLQAHVPEDAGRKWMRSESQTPMFNRAKDELLKNSRFKLSAGWSSEVSTFYWKLCDVVHVRGEKASLDSLQPTHLMTNGIRLPEFTQSSTDLVATTFIDTARHIATIVALENPILLVGLDLLQKFGLNPPMSGFFELSQAHRLTSLLIPSVKPEVLELLLLDPEVLAVRDWVENLPPLSSDQVQEQKQAQDQFLESMRTGGGGFNDSDLAENEPG